MLLIIVSIICACFTLLAIAVYISMRRECMALRYELDRLYEERSIVIDFLHRMTEDISKGSSREEIFSSIVRVTATACGAMGACVYEKLPDGKFKSTVTEGLFPPLAHNIPEQDELQTRSKFLESTIAIEVLEPEEGIISEVAREKKGLIIRNASNDPRVRKHPDSALNINSLILVPMGFRDTTYGVLAVINPISGKAFTQIDFSLATSLGEYAGLALHNRDAISTHMAKKKMEYDLYLASNVQRYLLPSKLPVSDKLGAAAKYIPQQLIGGDFYDFFRLSSGKYAMVIGDVSGKGVSAAILMVLCQTKLRYIAYTNKSPAEILKTLNAELVPAMHSNRFITMTYAIVDTINSKITLARAGHELPILYKSAEKEVVEIDSEGMVIGMADTEDFDESIKDITIPFNSGDVFALYTDGITETRNLQEEEYGSGRLSENIAKFSDKSAQEICDELMKSVESFKVNNTAPYVDDLTLLVVKNTTKSER